MIDINTPEARAKLELLPWFIGDDIADMSNRTHELERLIRGCEGERDPGKARAYRVRLAIAVAALNAAIVAAFEPLTVHDHSSDVARILGGDV